MVVVVDEGEERAVRGGTTLEPDIVREITEPRVVRLPLSGGGDGGTRARRKGGGGEEGRKGSAGGAQHLWEL